MTCLLCDTLSERFDLAVENNWQHLTPLYLQALSEHADMCHCETHLLQVEKYMTLPINEYLDWYNAQEAARYGDPDPTPLADIARVLSGQVEAGRGDGR